MLFTRCPQCTTTFRVTDEALNKAGGRVRCGRCASVFNAKTELFEANLQEAAKPAAPVAAGAAAAVQGAEAAGTARPPSAPETTPPPPARAAEPATTAAAPRAADAPAEPAASDPAARVKSGAVPAASAAPLGPAPAAAAAAADAAPAGNAAAGNAAADAAGPPTVPTTDAQRESEPRAPEHPSKPVDPYDGAVAAIVTQIERGAAESAREDEHDAAREQSQPTLPDQRVDEVLATSGDSPSELWTFDAHPRARSKWWTAAAALALLVLGAQVVHHFRADLASEPTLGPYVQRAYALLGATVTPNWDVRQYQILDWVAAAEPNARGQGTLEIKARIHNRGPRAQPYPHVHVELKDRWEDTVGRRTFRPAEYLETPTNASMPAGATVEARLEVVDPGPDAYGFELDVCVEAESRQLTCGNDEIFLQ